MPLPHRLGVFVFAFAAATAIAQDPPRRPKGDVWESDDYEEKALLRAVERAQRTADSEGKRWERELAKAFPMKHKPGLTEDDVTRWFDLLAGDGKDWRRDAAPSKAIADLFDRVAQRMELGPVPSIRREEYLQFAKGRLAAPQRQPKPEERFADADRAFRILDRDGSGHLEAAEWTERIRNDIKTADADGNRRISPEEYREHFARKVTETAEATAAAQAKVETATAREGKWPEWLKKLDTDGDGQVGLYEWRASNRPVEEFLAMDLDGDGLLPPVEYLRYVHKAAEATRSQSAEKKPMEPPEHRAGMERK